MLKKEGNMNFKNINLDFYDDKGQTLKEVFQNQEDLPDIVKTASISADKSNNDYALILEQDSKLMRKFDTSDAGNTWLSSLYYTINRDKLPVEAQKTAASLIKEACEFYNIPVTETIENDSIENVNTNVVNVSGKSPPVLTKTATANIYALGDKYPISNASELSKAISFFNENYRRMEPVHRREFAVKVASVADVMGVPSSEQILNYSGDSYSDTLDAHLSVRYQYLNELGADDSYKHEIVKLASHQTELDPVQFALILEKIDTESNLNVYWDKHISDPFYATFNIEKNAMGTSEPQASFSVGDTHVTERELKLLASDPTKLRGMFGEKMSNEFAKEPVAIFQSMPLPQKKIIAKMASDIVGRV